MMSKVKIIKKRCGCWTWFDDGQWHKWQCGFHKEYSENSKTLGQFKAMFRALDKLEFERKGQ
jgi:hypothetical protein